MDPTENDITALRSIAKLYEVGYPPTIREIQQAIGHGSPSTTLRLVQRLRKLGLVTKPRGARTMLITEDGRKLLGD